MAASATSLSSSSSLPSRRLLSPPPFLPSPSFLRRCGKCLVPSLSLFTAVPRAKSYIAAASSLDKPDPEDAVAFDLEECPENLIPASIDESSFETEEEIAAAYEKIYGPAYSGISVLGNDVNVMDKKLKKMTSFGKIKREKVKDGFEERVVEVRRVTKVVKGGKQLNFRAVVVVGDKKGRVGVGVAKASEVSTAVQKSALDARREIVTVPMTKYLTFPHRSDGKFGAAEVMLRPACPGTGVIAGGAVRVVLEMAGVENALGKQLRSSNPLNNARATLIAVLKMRQFREVAEERGIPMEELWK